MSRRDYKRGSYRPGRQRYPWQGNIKVTALEYGHARKNALVADLPEEERKKRVLRWANAVSKKFVPLPVPKTEREDD